MRYARGALIAALLTGTLATTGAEAVTFGGVGGRIGSVTPEAFRGTMQYGAHVELGLGRRLVLQPSLLSWSERGAREVNANLDALYHVGIDRMSTPYLGAGVGAFNRRFDGADAGTDVGLNLIGGIRFPATQSSYYIEGRYAAMDRSQFSILGGATFQLPR